MYKGVLDNGNFLEFLHGAGVFLTFKTGIPGGPGGDAGSSRGGAENDGHEIAGHEIDGPSCRARNCRVVCPTKIRKV